MGVVVSARVLPRGLAAGFCTGQQAGRHSVLRLNETLAAMCCMQLLLLGVADGHQAVAAALLSQPYTPACSVETLCTVGILCSGLMLPHAVPCTWEWQPGNAAFVLQSQANNHILPSGPNGSNGGRRGFHTWPSSWLGVSTNMQNGWLPHVGANACRQLLPHAPHHGHEVM